MGCILLITEEDFKQLEANVNQGTAIRQSHAGEFRHTSASPRNRVRSAARAGLTESGSWVGEQGRAGERAVMARLELENERVGDLNKIKSNFPVIDVTTDRRIQSVKVKAVGKAIDKSTADQYRYDFEDLLHPQKAEKAAKELLAHKHELQTSGAWPRTLREEPSLVKVTNYIRQTGQLAVPDDHVAEVRQNIRSMAKRIPERYGLDPDSVTLEQEIEALVARVQPIGVTADEIAEMQSDLKESEQA